MIDWDAVPVTEVPISRFILPLHDISPESLALPDQEGPVLAFARGEDLWFVNGRHRTLRRLLRGEKTVQARVLMIP